MQRMTSSLFSGVGRGEKVMVVWSELGEQVIQLHL